MDAASHSTVNISVHHSAGALSLEEELNRFWELEEVLRSSILSVDDEKCEDHFRNIHFRSAIGRYIVRLPFKQGPPIEIGESRSQANRVLAFLFRRLSSCPEHAAEYQAFLTEYEQLGHMRTAPVMTPGDQTVFIPHHRVFRGSSLTSRLRVVFNASSITSNGTSLNDHLLPGLKLQTEMSAVILRWRSFKYVYTADIAKMYRQILLDSRDSRYQHILWKPSARDALSKFQLLTVTYGMCCAPFLALRVLSQLATNEGSNYPLVTPILRKNIYVDDVLFGGDNLTVIRQTRQQLTALLRRGGFALHKWASNSSSLFSDIDPNNYGLACEKTLSTDEHIKILRIGWRPAQDVFQFAVSLSETVPRNKRSIFSAIAKLYDPLGWATPVTINAKTFIQQLWREKLGWDDAIPESLFARWSLIYTRLKHLNGLQIARWNALGSDVLHAELHGFSDASISRTLQRSI